MARVAITEYAAKRLCFDEKYVGFTATPLTIVEVAKALPEDFSYVVKVDVGIKKRGKQGLISINKPKDKVISAAEVFFTQGHERVIIEPFVQIPSEAERYLSLELVREGTRVLYSEKGGVEIEANQDSVKEITIPRSPTFSATPTLVIPEVPLSELLSKMQEYHFSFLEINPYVLQNKVFLPLDMAVEIDSARESKLPEWAKEHVLHKKAVTSLEKSVLEQDARTQAALNLHTLNENGSILTLFSGGGASLVALDSLVAAGLSDEVINYSEYSGAPTRDETAEYVRTLLQLLFDSGSKRKVILVAGGVANFTDVMATFEGIVDALRDKLLALKDANVYVCVRRGGPNQTAGLAHLRDWLTLHKIDNDVYDPSLPLHKVADLVKTHL